MENNSEQSDGKKRNYRNKKIEKKKKLNKIADLKTRNEEMKEIISETPYLHRQFQKSRGPDQKVMYLNE